MSRSKIALVLLALVAVLTATWIPREAHAKGNTVLGLHVFGPAQNESTSPTEFVYTVPVYDIATGTELGTLHDEITCSTTSVPCLVFDVATTLKLRDGTVLENHAPWSGVPDPQHPGFLLVGTRPDSANARGTAGPYAGRKALWIGSGSVDIRSFPATLGYDIYSIVTVD